MKKEEVIARCCELSDRVADEVFDGQCDNKVLNFIECAVYERMIKIADLENKIKILKGE